MFIILNGLSMGTGGGLTVGRELAVHLALARPQWTVGLLVIDGFALHAELKGVEMPSNMRLIWAPSETRGIKPRARYERTELVKMVRDDRVDAVVQLNGMVVPGMPVPTVCHYQDPWPYRREAWTRLRDRFIAALKRRAIRRSLRSCEVATFTSSYLRGLVSDRSGVEPRKAAVVYNGVPDDWLDRENASIRPLPSRPLTIVTVSNVAYYKRQWLVVEAMGLLHQRGELGEVTYRIGGSCSADVRADLEARARRHGIEDHVVVEGRVSDERVQEMLADARAYVLMSVCESFGIPAIEAMTFGTPVVLADCCAIPEVCGKAGWLVPVDDVEALADTLNTVIKDVESAGDAANAGRERAKAFRWSASGEQLAELLEAFD